MTYGNLFNLKPIQSIALSFVLGSAAATLFYCIYFYARGILPKLSTYFNSEQKETLDKVYHLFITRGFNIFLQLLSELGAVYIQPFTARLFLPKQYLSMIFAALNASGNLNVYEIVPAITGSQATANSADTSLRKIRNGSDDPTHYDDIRKIINTAFWGMIIFSSVINVGLATAFAPQITSLFYDASSITMPGPTSNPYIIVAVTGIGTTIDYVRNLGLFVLRSFSVDTYGTAISYLCLWVINLILVAACSQIKDIGVFGELAPYYCSILIGTCLLWQRVGECTKDLETVKEIAEWQKTKWQNPEANVSPHRTQRILPEWIIKNLYTALPAGDDNDQRAALLT